MCQHFETTPTRNVLPITVFQSAHDTSFQFLLLRIIHGHIKHAKVATPEFLFYVIVKGYIRGHRFSSLHKL